MGDLSTLSNRRFGRDGTHDIGLRRSIILVLTEVMNSVVLLRISIVHDCESS